MEEFEPIDEVLGRHGVDQGNMETAVELARRVADETGLCCEALGGFIYRTYQILEREHGYNEA